MSYIFPVMIILETPAEVAKSLAQRLRQARLQENLSRATLAERSGVSLGSLTRFERSGRVSLKNLLALALALGRLDEFAQLFVPREVESIADLERRASTPKRQRGRR